MNNAFLYALNERPFHNPPARPPRKRAFDVPFIELIRPSGYWPFPLSIEQAFETMRWMIETGTDSKYQTQLRWGYAGVATLVNGASCLGNSYIDPITSLADLRQRFHYAILARAQCESQDQWRQDFDVTPSGAVTLRRPTYRPFDGADHLGWRSEADIKQALETLLNGCAGVRMAVALNTVHGRKVNYLHDVVVHIYPKSGFVFTLRYGTTPKKKMFSRWGETIAKSRKGESFLDTMARARDVYDCLVHGKANGADTGDIERSYRPEYVEKQIAALASKVEG